MVFTQVAQVQFLVYAEKQTSEALKSIYLQTFDSSLYLLVINVFNLIYCYIHSKK